MPKQVTYPELKHGDNAIPDQRHDSRSSSSVQVALALSVIV